MGIGHRTALRGKGTFAASPDDFDEQLGRAFSDGGRRRSQPRTVIYDPSHFHRLCLADSEARQLLDRLRGLFGAVVAVHGEQEGTVTGTVSKNTEASREELACGRARNGAARVIEGHAPVARTPRQLAEEEHRALFLPYAALHLANYGIGDDALLTTRVELPSNKTSSRPVQQQQQSLLVSMRAVELLAHHPYLTTLNLSFNGLTSVSVVTLVHALRGSGSCDCKDRYSGDATLQSAGDQSGNTNAKTKNCRCPLGCGVSRHLRHLSLAGNAPGVEGCAALADWLAAVPDTPHPTQRHSHHHERDHSAAERYGEETNSRGSIASEGAKGCPLEELSLFHCALDDEAAITLLSGLAGLPSRSLGMDNSSENAMLVPNTALKLLDLNYNAITSRTLLYLRDNVLPRNDTLAVVLLESVPYSTMTLTPLPIDGAKRIAYACTPMKGERRPTRMPSNHRSRDCYPREPGTEATTTAPGADGIDGADGMYANADHRSSSHGKNADVSRSQRESLRRRLLTREISGVVPLPRALLADVERVLAPRRAAFVAARTEAERRAVAEHVENTSPVTLHGYVECEERQRQRRGDAAHERALLQPLRLRRTGTPSEVQEGHHEESEIPAMSNASSSGEAASATQEERMVMMHEETNRERGKRAATAPAHALRQGRWRRPTADRLSMRSANTDWRVATAMANAAAFRNRHKPRCEPLPGLAKRAAASIGNQTTAATATAARPVGEGIARFRYKNGLDVISEMSEETAMHLHVAAPPTTIAASKTAATRVVSADGLLQLTSSSQPHRRVRVAAHDIPVRDLRACWCAPRHAMVLYSGTLHYHCRHEGSALDVVPQPMTAAMPSESVRMRVDSNKSSAKRGNRSGNDNDDTASRYAGCRGTAHRCMSANRRGSAVLTTVVRSASVARHQLGSARGMRSHHTRSNSGSGGGGVCAIRTVDRGDSGSGCTGLGYNPVKYFSAPYRPCALIVDECEH